MRKILPTILLVFGSMASGAPVLAVLAVGSQYPLNGSGSIIYLPAFAGAVGIFLTFAFMARLLYNSEKQRESLDQINTTIQKLEMTHKNSNELWYRVK